MALVVMHTYAQVLFEAVVAGLLLLGTAVALLLEPASALARRWAQRRGGWSRARVSWLWLRTIPAAVGGWALVLGGLGAVLAILVWYGLCSDALGRAQLGLVVDGLAAPERFVLLARTTALQPLALAGAACVAVGLGAAHALAPGHSKTLVAAYLIGARGTAAQALLLGLSVTVTHTAGVFGLGLVSLALTQFIAPAQWLPWIESLAGALVLLLGARLLHQRLQPHASHTHPHTHPHAHPHAHHLNQGSSQEASTRSWLVLGIAGGLVPCPSALALLLTAIGLGRTGLGILLTAAFSLGLAGVLTGVGLACVYGQRWFNQRTAWVATEQFGRLRRTLPLISAVFVTAVGAGIMLNALAQTNLLR